MAIVDISATLDGEATAVAAATREYTASMTAAGSSTVEADASYLIAAVLAASSALVAEAYHLIEAGLAGESLLTGGAEVVLAGGASLHGGSSMYSLLAGEVRANLGAESGFIATVDLLNGTEVHADGDSAMAGNVAATYQGSTAIVAGSSLAGTASYARIYVTASMAGSADLLGDAISLGEYGADSYGGSPYGGAFPAFGLLSATAISPTQVRVRYSAMFDAGFPLLLAITNYTTAPALVINSIVLESAQSIILNTEPQAHPLYTLTIAEAQGFFGQPLDPKRNSVQFSGSKPGPTFYAVATGKRRIRVVFAAPMFSNSALTDPLQYVLTDVSNQAVLIESVTTEQLHDVRSTVLHLGADLVDERHYRVTVLSGIISAELTFVSPDTDSFQWVDNPLLAEIPISDFSGEATGGLFGTPDGLVFFSPALEHPAANSIIEVEQVDVCTRAFDEYHIPETLDPVAPLMTHGLDIAPTPQVSTLNSPDWVLWAAFPRLSEARFDFAFSPLLDQLPQPTDDQSSATVSLIYPPERVSLLNAVSWKLFEVDGNAASITAVVVDPGTGVGTVTVAGLSGMSRLDMGKVLTIRGADNPANNGNFLIVWCLSESSVEIRNDAGAAPDANNGSLVWLRPAEFITADNLTPFPPPGPSNTTILGMLMAGEASQATDAQVL